MGNHQDSDYGEWAISLLRVLTDFYDPKSRTKTIERKMEKVRIAAVDLIDECRRREEECTKVIGIWTHHAKKGPDCDEEWAVYSAERLGVKDVERAAQIIRSPPDRPAPDNNWEDKGGEVERYTSRLGEILHWSRKKIRDRRDKQPCNYTLLNHVAIRVPDSSIPAPYRFLIAEQGLKIVARNYKHKRTARMMEDLGDLIDLVCPQFGRAK